MGGPAQAVVGRVEALAEALRRGWHPGDAAGWLVAAAGGAALARALTWKAGTRVWFGASEAAEVACRPLVLGHPRHPGHCGHGKGLGAWSLPLWGGRRRRASLA